MAGQADGLRPLSGPEVWTGEGMALRDDWVHRLDAAEAAELETAVRRVRRDFERMYAVTVADFPLPTLAARLARIGEELEHGCGIANLRGVPVARLDEEDLRWLLWGLGAHLGTAVSQNKPGELFAEVRDYGEQLGTPSSRGYRTNASLRFHTDRCDVVALLCVRQCLAGGESRVVSTPAIHNAMLERRPDLLALLYGSWCHSRQSEEAPGERRFYEAPVFSLHRGRFSSQYSRSYVESAQRFTEVPRLAPAQDEALDLLAALADELALNTRMQPGDIQLLNNHVTLHARTDITDHDDPARKRLVYRLWLSVPGSRELAPAWRELWRDTAAGALRGGVTPRTGIVDADAWRRASRR